VNPPGPICYDNQGEMPWAATTVNETDTATVATKSGRIAV
jgi:hypothetical protein